MANSAFNECISIQSISLPSTFKSFGMWVFWDCLSIQKFEVAESNPYFVSIDGILYSKDKKTLVQYPAGSPATELKVPEGTEILGFASCEGAMNLEKVTIPESCKMLDGASLYMCENLKECIMHDNVEIIGNEVFYGCSNLANVKIPANIKTLGSGAFTGCTSFTHMVVPEQITYIEFRLFYNCSSLKTVEFSNKAETIDQEAFSGCTALESMTIPASVSYIAPLAFDECTSMNNITVYNTTGNIAGVEISQLIPRDIDGNYLENERIIYVPKGHKADYTESSFWKNAKEIREFDPESTDINAAVAEGSVININGTDVNVTTENGMIDIYTVDGVLFDRFSAKENNIEIPAGMYIINGKKIIVK